MYNPNLTDSQITHIIDLLMQENEKLYSNDTMCKEARDKAVKLNDSIVEAFEKVIGVER